MSVFSRLISVRLNCLWVKNVKHTGKFQGMTQNDRIESNLSSLFPSLQSLSYHHLFQMYYLFKGGCGEGGAGDTSKPKAKIQTYKFSLQSRQLTKCSLILACKRSEIVTRSTTWMGLHDITLSEFSQIQDSYCMVPFIWSTEVIKCIETESKRVVARGWRREWGGAVWGTEFFLGVIKKAWRIAQCKCTWGHWIVNL